ncbi:MAG: DUF4494 domain-containing protein [Brumimicrobium sp.]
MSNWFTVKVKYTKQLDNGKLKRVTEPYLVDAATFTDAEKRIQYEIGLNVRGEFDVTGISRTNYTDIFYYDDSDDWYKCKITYTSVDADEQGKEKKITGNFMVTANNVKEAFERIKESIADMISSYEIPAISLTNIVDVFPYDKEFEAENIIGDIIEKDNIGGQLNDFDMEKETEFSEEEDEGSDLQFVDESEEE